MELEELKNIWKNNKEEFQPKNETQLASMLNGTSKSLIDKLKCSVWFELKFTIVAGIALLIYALLLPSGSLKWATVSILILFVGYSFYYVKKLLLLSRFQPGEDHLKANLKKLVDNLSSYIKFYKLSFTLLYPVYFCLGILFGGLETGSEKFFENLSNPKIIGYLTIVALVLFFVSTWFTRWYLKKLYGNHLEKLNGLLKELNAIE